MPANDQRESKSRFEEAAGEEDAGFIMEFIGFLAENKKWWLLPIIIILLLFGALLILGGTGAAPFIYSLF